ncbi:hypothetical protein F4781DRAFT_382674 [Annulohypoxylon bovei var. microspora]|nr:hypothetical protein F4781DRAFT_382674 [Annulohypoxylon bovei var. microspora]
MTTSTPTLTLVDSWTPTQSGCLRTDDYWIWDYQTAFDQRTVLGGPAQITNCLPSSWGGNVTYVGTGCPPMYTSACQGTNSAAVVTCCPWAYSFACEPQSSPGVRHAESFRCVSQESNGNTITVTRTSILANSLATETRVESTAFHLFALAIVYSTPASTSITSSATGTSSQDNPSATGASPQDNSSALSPGQAAGVGAGVGVGVILLVSIIAFFLWRRRALSKHTENTQSVAQYTNYPVPPKTPRELPTISALSELDAMSSR